MVMDFPFNNNSKILTFENVILSNVDTLNVIFVDIIVVVIYFIIIMQTSEFAKTWRS